MSETTPGCVVDEWTAETHAAARELCIAPMTEGHYELEARLMGVLWTALDQIEYLQARLAERAE